MTCRKNAISFIFSCFLYLPPRNIMQFLLPFFIHLIFDCFSTWRDNKNVEKILMFVCAILISMPKLLTHVEKWQMIFFLWFLHMHSKQDNRSNIHSFAMVIMGGEKSVHAIRCVFFILFAFGSFSLF